MKSLFSLIFLLSLSVSFAQPRLPLAAYTPVGSNNKYIVVDATDIHSGSGGANQVWDFRSITPTTDTFRQWIISPTDTKYSAGFKGANTVEKNSDSTYVFLRLTTDSNTLIGYYDIGQNFKIYYDKPGFLIKRPVGYLDSAMAPNRDHFDISGQSFTGSGESGYVADGYGTLMLPGKTYSDVLRIKYSRYEHDTSNTGYTSDVTVISYAWMDASHRVALFKLDSTVFQSLAFNQTTKDARYIISEFVSGIKETDENSLNLRAAYSESGLRIFGISALEQPQIWVMDAIGRTVYTGRLSAGETTINCKLRPGIYFLKTGGESSAGRSAKFIAY